MLVGRRASGFDQVGIAPGTEGEAYAAWMGCAMGVLRYLCVLEPFW